MASSSSYAKLSLFLVALAAVSWPLMAGKKADAQLLGGVGNVLSLLNINGTLSCSATASSTGITSPVFPNATVQLQCGGTVISTSITNASGAFSFILNPLQILLTDLLSSNCKLVITTPLSTCNASLPSAGTLVSSLQSLGNITVGLLRITQLVPTGFQLQAN